MDAIFAERLTKLYGSFVAVNSIDFRVEEGSSFALIGPNGAGKTTTLRMITGLISPTSGTLRVLGGNPRDKDVRRQMSILPEDAGVYEKLTVRETIYYYGLLRGLSRTDASARTEELIKRLGLEFKTDEYGSKLSKGLKRKALLGMCLVNDPKLLVLDEPTDGLDVRSARAVRDLLLGLLKEGKSIVVTSHDMMEIQTLARTIALIDRGKLTAIGEPEQLMAEFGLPSLEDLFIKLTQPEPDSIAS